MNDAGFITWRGLAPNAAWADHADGVGSVWLMSPSTPARRGRPRKSDAPDTHVRLLAAAASACVDHGFDGATLQEIARRAGLTATAVYNHFASQIGRAHVCNPVTNATLVCRLLLEKKNKP